MKRYLLVSGLICLGACNGGGTGSPGSAGTTGTPGSAGTNATAGTNGAAGTNATAGTNGAAGTTGTPGTAGTNATAGTNGAAGTNAIAGTTGTAGRGGTTGTAGTSGGGAGRGGTTGTAGTGVAGTGGGVTGDQNVLQRNKNPSRDGHFLQPTLTKTAAATMMPDAAFNSAATFTGNVAASPVYLDGANGGGLFIIPTTGGDVVARKENGTQAWPARSIGAPATGSFGCSMYPTMGPLGVLSTPAIDAQSRTIYVAGITGAASNVMAQIVTAINADDGTVKSGWPVNLSTAASFDPKIHNQRSALSLVNGTLYVPYAGYVGDCGSYHGRVVAINTANPTMVGQWQTSDQGAGIWAPGGLASDGTSVYATTGNYTPFGQSPATHGDSEQVTRITGMGTKADFFYPSNWATMDMNDADFGSVNPMLITVPGATPSKIIVALAKDGKGYLLDADQLRGSSSGTAAGGQKVAFTLASGSMSIYGAPASYRTATGTYVVMSTSGGATGCPAGGSGRQVMAVRIGASPLAATTAWCASMAGGPTNPIATTSDGTSDAIVWFTTNNQLRGVDGDTGAMIYGGTTACGGTIQKWTSPIAVKGRIVVAANGRFCAWGVPGSLTQAQAAPTKPAKHKRKLAAAASIPPQ